MRIWNGTVLYPKVSLEVQIGLNPEINDPSFAVEGRDFTPTKENSKSG